MANNTRNPIPSSNPLDFIDNTENLDLGMNSTEETFLDRFGRPRNTYQAFHNLVINAKNQIDPTVDAAKQAVNSAAQAAIDEMEETAAELGADINTKRYTSYVGEGGMLSDPQSRDNVVGIVDGDPDGKLNGWYVWNNTTKAWVRFAVQPVTTADFQLLAAFIKASQTPAVTHSFEDANGFLIGEMTIDQVLRMQGGLDMANGRIMQGSGILELLDPNGFVAGRIGTTESFLGGLTWRNTNTPGIEVGDEYGFLLARYDGTSQAAGNGSLTPPPFPMLNAQLRTQIMLIICYGQSLSRGINSVPAISTTQPYNNIMIASGTKVRNGDTGYNPSSFVPLIAKTEGTEGEDPVHGLCNGVVRRAIADGEAATDWVFLGTSPGRSARSVEELGPSADFNAFYNKMVRYVQDAKNLADATGKSFSCWAYCWDQGESNYAGSTFTKSPYQYAQLMLALFDTLTRQVVAITGQQFQPYIFSYQVGGHRFYGVDKNTVALAQWRISRERPDFVLAVPVYAIPVVTDDVHLTNEGSWLLGEYRSRAMYQTMIRRSGKWRPLEPIKVDWQADHIDVKFHVPSGPLVLDTAICAQAVNMGFDVREGDAVVDIITGVTVLSDDTVRIAISREANATAALTYARGRPTDANKSGPLVGPRGNLRDSQGLRDTAVSPLGNTFALHNPCVMFQYSRATGF
ncbi:hypothetical protein [Pseudomonas fulva]|uniref:hypothetical protein n=1 Tax=Pseudomonas fulva TaxID=47880 RepID=UPI0018AA588F|nr:hypothetical protein [Pseudomonas fulva]MBF8773880.1 hypothetical protein [Pseudomonas fulva]